MTKEPKKLEGKDRRGPLDDLYGYLVRRLLWLRKGNENTRGAPARK
jgi:hypothetical protein